MFVTAQIKSLHDTLSEPCTKDDILIAVSCSNIASNDFGSEISLIDIEKDALGYDKDGNPVRHCVKESIKQSGGENRPPPACMALAECGGLLYSV